VCLRMLCVSNALEEFYAPDVHSLSGPMIEENEACAED
jgi:hypothetical protein